MHRPFECHVIWMTMNGIYNIENQNLEDLSKARCTSSPGTSGGPPRRGRRAACSPAC
ncbi:MAG: hypothetical protein ACREKG_00480 [Candidatus Rokuibacteriota bacterium]